MLAKKFQQNININKSFLHRLIFCLGFVGVFLMVNLFLSKHALAETLDYTPTTDDFSGQAITSPRGVAVIPAGATGAGKTYVVGESAKTVYRFDTSGSGIAVDGSFTPFTPSVTWTSPSCGSVSANGALGPIAVDVNGNIYLTIRAISSGCGNYWDDGCGGTGYYDSYYSAIAVYNSSGTQLAIFNAAQDNAGGYAQPSYGLAVTASSANNIVLYASDYFAGQVNKFTTTTGVTGFSAAVNFISTGLSAPQGLVLDSTTSLTANLFVADTANNAVKRYAYTTTLPTNTPSNTLTTDGTIAFYNPTYIALDSSNNLYISDSSNNRILKFTSSYTFSSKSTASMYLPHGIAIGGGSGSNVGKIFVADLSNNLVKRFTVNSSGADTTAPSISAFTLPSTSSALNFNISSLTATDAVGVTAWMVKDTANTTPPSAPASGDAGWQTSGITGTTSVSIAGSITASTSGTRYFWAYTKDAAGNVSSASSYQSVVIDITAPSITAFTLPGTSSAFTFSISSFTATDAVGVIAWMVKETANTTPPSSPASGDAGWLTSGITGTTSASIAGSITTSTSGTRYFWAYTKDAMGNVSSASSYQSVDITSTCLGDGGGGATRFSGAVKFKGNSLVNDCWFAPGATGCTIGAGDICRASTCMNVAGINTCVDPCDGVSSVTDTRDTNDSNYNTVAIGTQCWMARNENVGTMINSSAMPTNDSAFEKWCNNNNSANCNTHGGLYTWAEANGLGVSCLTNCGVGEPNQGICPSGWHIPSDDEWYTLENYLKDNGQTCNASRSSAWDCDSAGTKLKPGGSSNFNAQLAGFLYSGSFTGTQDYNGYFISSQGYGLISASRALISSNSTVQRISILKSSAGYTARCIKD